jgi:hypothetical protein
LPEGEDTPPFRTILSEAVLPTPLREVAQWRGQLDYVMETADRPHATVHVFLHSAPPHGLMTGDHHLSACAGQGSAERCPLCGQSP